MNGVIILPLRVRALPVEVILPPKSVGRLIIGSGNGDIELLT